MTDKGLPPQFVSLLDRLHASTNVRFVVNGTRSVTVPQTSGIRQGCPLAPSLFILATEPLLATLQAWAWEHGILLRHGESTYSLICNSHVDDTASFLRHLDSLPVVLKLLDDFGDMPGVQIQLQKSFRLCLNLSHIPLTAYDIPFVSGDDWCLYLDIQVGLGSFVQANWEACYT
ncbi:hypothetical protein B5M09_012149 [Aphanomyces astaci]|uniref:Reverse transcriptase domain-containing protein n=1 Tax=Aphanomyces astaci TaxID=112090 RepID=A0A425D323_APHAT|nr:hypothetical protein B5M09_012149 [Aphanomyces astaci]